MLSRLVINASTILRHTSLAHESFVEQYAKDDVYEALINGNRIQEVNYHVHNNLSHHLGKICIPRDDRVM